jgi:uncharacterized protein involved in exopolysaccharide biosynthesis
MSNKKMSLLDHWNIIWKYRKNILIIVASVSIITAIISLILPKWYRATSVILPPTEEQNPISSLRSDMAAFGLMGMFGGDQSQMKILAILKSRSLLEALDKKYNFQKRYDLKNKQLTYNAMRDNIKVEVGEEMQIIFSIEDKSQELVAEMTNYAIHCLDSISIKLSTKKARENRKFLENRVETITDSLEFYENKISDLMGKTNFISPEGQLPEEIRQAAMMRAELTGKELKYRLLKKTLAPDNKKLKRLKLEIKLLKDEYNQTFIKGDSTKLFVSLENAPEIQKKFGMLKRNVLYYKKLLEFVGPQYEKAKMDEKRDTETVQVLDKARRPDKRFFPHRSLMVILAFIASSFIAIAGFLIRERYKT